MALVVELTSPAFNRTPAGEQTVLRLDANSFLRWTAELHRFKGNLLYADGHVDKLNRPALVVKSADVNTVAALAMPTDEPPSGAPPSNPEIPSNPSLGRPPSLPGNQGSGKALPGTSPTSNPPPVNEMNLSAAKQSGAQPTLQSASTWLAHTQQTNSISNVVMSAPRSQSIVDQEELVMGKFDYKLMKLLRSMIKWWYLLLLLLVLLFITCSAWREWNKRQERRGLRKLLEDEI